MKGFTLLECIITLTIVGVLFFFLAPFSQALIHQYRSRSVQHDIENAIQMAKTKAYSENKAFSLAPLTDDLDWSQGINLLDTQSHIIHRWDWSYPHIKVVWQGFMSNVRLTISPRLEESSANGRFLIAFPQGSIQLKVNKLGHVNAKQGWQ